MLRSTSCASWYVGTSSFPNTWLNSTFTFRRESLLNTSAISIGPRFDGSFFASITAHTAPLFPLFLAVAIKIPVVSPVAWALLLAFPLGMIGILTPYASGQNAVYFGSGYIKRRDFWVLGFILSVVYMTVYLAIIVKWLEYLGV